MEMSTSLAHELATNDNYLTSSIINLTSSVSDLFINSSLFNESSSNASFVTPFEPWKQQLFKVYRAVLLFFVVFIMYSMGCYINFADVHQTLRRPKGVLIGMLCQFVLMPLVAFAYAFAFRLDAFDALGLVFIATSPGGVISNIYAYWVKGDVTLSVTMTTLSTIATFFMMPLNLWIYTKPWTTTTSVVPFLNIFITLTSITVPLAIGMLTKWKLPKVAHFIVQAGSAAGLLSVLITITMQFILNPHILTTSRWQVWVAGTALQLVSGSLGYGISALCRLTAKQCRTVAIETSCQNASMAISIVLMSFPAPEALRIQVLPMLYGPFMIINGIVMVAIYKAYFWTRAHMSQKHALVNKNISKLNGDLDLHSPELNDNLLDDKIQPTEV